MVNNLNRAKNKSKFLPIGVTPAVKRKNAKVRYRASLGVSGTVRYLGTFESIREAFFAYQKAFKGVYGDRNPNSVYTQEHADIDGKA